MSGEGEAGFVVGEAGRFSERAAGCVGEPECEVEVVAFVSSCDGVFCHEGDLVDDAENGSVRGLCDDGMVHGGELVGDERFGDANSAEEVGNRDGQSIGDGCGGCERQMTGSSAR